MVDSKLVAVRNDVDGPERDDDAAVAAVVREDEARVEALG